MIIALWFFFVVSNMFIFCVLWTHMIREIWIGTCRLVEIYGNDIATAARGFVLTISISDDDGNVVFFLEFAIGKQLEIIIEGILKANYSIAAFVATSATISHDERQSRGTENVYIYDMSFRHFDVFRFLCNQCTFHRCPTVHAPL